MAHSKEKCCSDDFWFYIVAVVLLLLFSGLMSGLTLGLMSLGLVDLEVIRESGTPKDRMNAARIIPVVRKQHLLLVTLLVGNAMAMEALPLFLDSLVDTWMAILLSVTLLLMFGEILPQAVCSRYGLAVGATMAPVVRVLLVVMFPIAWPVSKLLDKILGTKHNDLFRRAELITLVRMHSYDEGKGGELSRHESNIIAGTLRLAGKTAADAMTPIASVVSIDVQSTIESEIMTRIVASGHSRIPVYSGEPHNIIGLILVKNFLNVAVDDGQHPIINVPIRRIQRVSEEMSLHDVLHEFCQRHGHIAVVVRSKKSIEEKQLTEPSPADSAPTKAKNTNSESGCASVHPAEDEAESGHFRSEANSTNEKGDSSAKRTDSSNSFNPPDAGIRGQEPWATWTGDNGDEIIGIITREDVLEELLKVSLNLDKSECKVPILDGKKPPNTPPRDLPIASEDDLLSNRLASPVTGLTNTSHTSSSFWCESPHRPQIILSFPPTASPTEALSPPRLPSAPEPGPEQSEHTMPETLSTWRNDDLTRVRFFSPMAAVHGQGLAARSRQIIATHRILHSR